MRIAILGGTGNLGRGLAMRLSLVGHSVIVGSRKEEKAQKLVESYRNEVLSKTGRDVRIDGLKNSDAARECDIAIITIPWEHTLETVESLKSELSGKIVLSPVVPITKKGKAYDHGLKNSSAAEKIASILDKSTVISALHCIPAGRFSDLSATFNWDVPVCGDDPRGKKVVINLINEMPGLNAYDAGPLSVSRLIEGLAPLLINVMVFNKLIFKTAPGIKFV